MNEVDINSWTWNNVEKMISAQNIAGLYDDDKEEKEEKKRKLSLIMQWRDKITTRKVCMRTRWNMDYFLDLAHQENSFVREYRVDDAGFSQLHEILKIYLQVDPKMAAVRSASTRSAPISTESRLGAALIMLAGGRDIEAMRTHGISSTFAYENLHRVVEAINSCPDLAILPGFEVPELEIKAKGFEDRSSKKLFRFMVGAMDGLAITIKAPVKSSTKSQLSYRSGSKHKFCLNMQAICDANLIFEAMTCMHTGSTNDIDAFNNSSLKTLCSSLPFPYHISADGAYCDTEQVMTPYCGVNLHITSPAKDSFNFWHSQLRITIERCFGVFIRRWGILWKPMGFRVSFVCQIVHACARLHNFCQKRKLPVLNNPEIDDLLVNSDGILIHPNFTDFNEIVDRDASGNSLKERICEEIQRNEYFHRRNINYLN